MPKKDLGDSREFTDTEIIMDAQTEVKMLIRYSIFSAHALARFDKELKKLLTEALKDVKDKDLQETARKTLYRFAYEQLTKTQNSIGFKQINLSSKIVKNLEKLQEVIDEIVAKNVNKVIPAFTNLGNSQPMTSSKQSLYGHAELVARYLEKKRMLEDLKKKTNIVICDTHTDCSDRCAPWQGGIYSLDNTYGVTSDGKNYRPLSLATEAKDEKGRPWGLLGYNCRHKLFPYKPGMQAPKVNEEDRKREYAITQKQRQYEQNIRRQKEMLVQFNKGDVYGWVDRYMTKAEQILLNNGEYNKLRKIYTKKIKKNTKEYKEFCRENFRVFYKSRLDIG